VLSFSSGCAVRGSLGVMVRSGVMSFRRVRVMPFVGEQSAADGDDGKDDGELRRDEGPHGGAASGVW
jgi:hypothetical protein